MIWALWQNCSSFRNCVEAVAEDLKRTLCKDVKKKIGETFAFYLYDQWWAEKEEKYKAEQRRKLESKKSEEIEKASNAADAPVHITAETAANAAPPADAAATAPAPSSNTSTPDKRATDIPPPAQGAEAQPAAAAASTSNALDVTSFFNQQREKMDAGGGSSAMIASAFGKGGSLGFGFRGTIPKLPSFKIKTKTAKRKDGRKSDGESSDDDDRSSHPGTSRGSGKRREQEKRREQRLREDRERQRRRKSDDVDGGGGGGGRRERDKSKSKARDRDSKKDDKREHASKDAKKPGRTLESIYSQIYSDDGSDSDAAGDKSGTKDLDISSDSDVPRKDAKRASTDTKAVRKDKRAAKGSVSSVAEDSSASSSSTVRSSSAMSEVSSRSSASSSSSSSSSASASSSSGVSSSSSSSSSSESEAEDKADVAKSTVEKVTEEEFAEIPEAAAVARKESSEEADVDVERDEAGPKTSPRKKGEFDSSGTDSSDEVEREAPATAEPEFKEPAAKSAPTTPVQTSLPRKPEVKIPEESPPHIIDHCYARPYCEEGMESPKPKENQFQDQVALDHGYTRPRTPPAEQKKRALQEKQKVAEEEEADVAVPASRTAGGRKTSAKAQKQQIVDETAPLKPIRGRTYKARTAQEQFEVLYKFLTKGLDLEDISYLKRSYHMMLNQNQAGQDKNLYWLNDTHWVDHTVTEIPSPPKSKRRRKDDFSRPHLTGSCRTEGYYKMDPREKLRTKYHLHRSGGGVENMFSQAQLAKLTKAHAMSREARSSQRRQLTVLGEDAIGSNLLSFNQLKVRSSIIELLIIELGPHRVITFRPFQFRRKQMTFGKSSIHDWGLFSLEDIGPDEMVIEYVGHNVRSVLSDVREKCYEKQGIGSSYLFRVDLDYVVDATKCGNLARFINHSCDVSRGMHYVTTVWGRN